MNLMGCGLVLGNILWSLRSREKGEEVPAEPCFERMYLCLELGWVSSI